MRTEMAAFPSFAGIKIHRWMIVALLLLGATVAIFWVSTRHYQTREIARLDQQAALYGTALVDTLERFAHFPLLLSQIPIIKTAPEDASVATSDWLARMAQEMGVEALYVMDRAGLTVAASNHRQTVTFLGQNYGFRPYFQAAMRGARGEFFAIGATTSRPGYFFAAPIRDTKEIAGAVAVKLDLSPLVERWRTGGEQVMVTNGEGVVVLSSDPALTYRTMQMLTPETRDRITAQRQFGTQSLDPLAWQARDETAAVLNGMRVLYVSRHLSRSDWTVHIVADAAGVTRQALVPVALFLAILGALTLAQIFVRTSRMRVALTASQEEEAKLNALNLRLRDEVAERQAAESALRAAQHSLAKASRLAALGELSATVTHELGQPLSAMRNYLAAAEFNPTRRDDPLIPQIEGVIRRMERTTAQLRDFSRPGEQDFEPVDLRVVVGSAHTLMAHDLDSASIAYSFRCTAPHPWVDGNAHRLEQVVVNLMRNAVAAMVEREEKRLDILLQANDEGRPVLIVRDTGEGFGEADIDTMTEPFYTTRPSGDGMGLGLAISAAILREHEAELRMRSRNDCEGAIVEIVFRAGKSEGGDDA